MQPTTDRREAKTDSNRTRQKVWRAPRLAVKHILVKAKGDAMVYTDQGDLISNETWSAVPVPPSIVMAIKYGDLEEAEEDNKPATDAAAGKRSSTPANQPAASRPAAPQGPATPAG